MVCGEEGLREVEKEGERDLILGGVGNLGMEDSHGKGSHEWKKNVCMDLCV